MKSGDLSHFPAVDNVGLGREVIQVVIEDATQRREVQQVNLPDGGLWCWLSGCFLLKYSRNVKVYNKKILSEKNHLFTLKCFHLRNILAFFPGRKLAGALLLQRCALFDCTGSIRDTFKLNVQIQLNSRKFSVLPPSLQSPGAAVAPHPPAG